MSDGKELEQSTIRDLLALDRTVLANERTLLAYVRTFISLVAGGVGLIVLFDFAFVRPLGCLFIIAGVVALTVGIVRFFITRKKIKSNYRQHDRPS